MKNNLQEHRNKAELSLQGLADICGITKQHIHNLEKEMGSSPTLDTAYAISAVLDKKVYDIWPDKTEIIEETITVRRVKKND